MKANSKIIILTISIIVFLFLSGVVVYKFYKGVNNLIPNKKASEFYREDNYSGIVSAKYIDSLQHNYRTIVVKRGNKTQKVLFDHENGGFFELVKVGDSLFKKKDTLDIRLKSKSLDTIIRLQIYDGN
ncbi:MAG: hypothetical protein CMC07_03295 [Flavobacteriaceae bacterium]|nr:hypothetical protein [Flavobacteriaceae bacterium]